MIYGYARVSTKNQELGNSLKSQADLLADYGCDVISCESYTGKTLDRPELTNILKVIVPGDRLVVTKLDRLSRSAVQGIELIQHLQDIGISINIPVSYTHLTLPTKRIV